MAQLTEDERREDERGWAAVEVKSGGGGGSGQRVGGEVV